MPFELVITFGRQLLLTLGATLVTMGYMNGGQLEAAVGVIISVATAFYGLWSKWETVDKIQTLKSEVKEVKAELKDEKSNHGNGPGPGYSPSTPGY